MNTSLKTGVKQHLERFELTPGQLEQLLSQQQATQAQSTPAKQRTWVLPLSIAASLAGIVLTAWLLLSPTTPGIIARIADEVALNHLKKRPLEIHSQQVAQLQAYFSELDFLPTGSATYAGINNAKLGGGRYCSIQGLGAAQLRYFDAQGNYASLFETAYDPAVFGKLPNADQGEQPLQVYARGVEVRLWVEKDLLKAAVKSNM